MKLIRMTKTMAGPNGVFSAGKMRTVSDAEAKGLVDAEAAEIVGEIVQSVTVESVGPAKESGATAGAPETAVQRKATPKKISKAKVDE